MLERVSKSFLLKRKRDKSKSAKSSGSSAVAFISAVMLDFGVESAVEDVVLLLTTLECGRAVFAVLEPV